MQTTITLNGKFYQVSSHCAKETDNLYRRFTSGRYCLSDMGTLLLKSHSYANANCWDDLVCAFTESLRGSFLDEIVLLLHADIPGPDGRRSEYVRPVSYNSLDEVPELLLSTTPSALRTGATLTHRRRPHVEVETGVQPDTNRDGQEKQKRIDILPGMIADEEEAEVVTPGWGYEEEIDEAEVNAARVIEDAYYCHLERKRTGTARKNYWRLLRKRSMQMTWSKDSRYYLLFRVPLAYILVCLDVIKAFVELEKKGAKKRMMTEKDKNLEDLMGALDQYRCDPVDRISSQGSNKPSSGLLKKTVALQKKLSPSSEFHKEQSVHALQYAVMEVKAIVDSLDDIPGSIETRNKIEEDWNRGWKWIFEK